MKVRKPSRIIYNKDTEIHNTQNPTTKNPALSNNNKKNCTIPLAIFKDKINQLKIKL